jgi:hypothetical protein
VGRGHIWRRSLTHFVSDFIEHYGPSGSRRRRDKIGKHQTRELRCIDIDFAGLSTCLRIFPKCDMAVRSS